MSTTPTEPAAPSELQTAIAKRLPKTDRAAGGWGYGHCVSYEQLIETFVDRIAINVAEDNYQGDSLLVVIRDGKTGYLPFGWGSCSGCDALMSCDTLSEVAELGVELYNSVRWFDTYDELRVWVAARDWDGTFFDSELVGEFRREVAATNVLTDDQEQP